MTEMLDNLRVDLDAIAATDGGEDRPRRGRRWGDADAELQEVFDRKPMVARCGLCDWTFEGTAGAARAAQFQHRQTHAKATATNGKRVRHLSQGLTADDRREAVNKMGNAKRRWTRDQLIERILAWASEHGQPPTANGWHKHRADGDWPTTSQVISEFGKWSDGIKAAGLAAQPTGGPQRPPRAKAPVPSAAAETTDPDPEPAEAPPGTLTALAQAVDQAQHDLDTAIARHVDALQALRDALEAA